MDDDRLVLETLRSAVRQGASCINYVSADGAEMKDGKVSAISCTDKLTGRKLRIKGRHVVSTVGPWTDEVASKLFGQWKKILRPTKGIHLTFDRKRLQLSDAIVMAAGKRIVFGIPRHEMIVIGTTDTDFSGDPYDVNVNENDVHYLLGVAAEYFPGAKLQASDILASYAGVRPLVDDGAETESKTSREHVIIKDPRNVTFVAGGKYTTYRLMAQQSVEAALESFDLESQVRFGRNDTKRALNPLATETKMDESYRLSNQWARQFNLNVNAVEMLISRHAGEALKILEDGERLPQAIGESSDERLWTLEARHAIRHTMCLNLIDFYVRRSPLFLARADHGLSYVGLLSRVFARELGWSDSRRQEEQAALLAHVQRELGWKQKFGINASSV
jgi:glycerol-3-phosphate dehydrogenase